MLVYHLFQQALKFVREYSFTNNSGDRPDASDILVVLTDGQSTGRYRNLNNGIVFVASTI